MVQKVFRSLLIPMLLGLGIISSFFREMVIAYYYGSSKDVEIYRIAFAIPYALFQSLGTVLIASLLPLYLADRKTLSYIQSSIKKVFLFITLFVMLTLPWQSVFFAPGFTENEQLILLYNMFICWSVVLISALIFPMRLVLQGDDKKILVSATSLLFSFLLVSLIILLNKKVPAYELSIASVASILSIYFVYKWNASKNIFMPEEIHIIGEKHKIHKIIIGSFVYIFLLSMPRMIDKAIASEMGDGVVANLDYAMNFYVAFGVLIGTSFTIIYAKKIAQKYNGDSINFKWLSQMVIPPFVLASLVSLILYPHAEEIVSLAYGRGAFTALDAMQVTSILHSFLIALPLMVVGMLLSQIIAAHSIMVLIAAIMVKILSKWLYIKLHTATSTLAIFGESTWVMELVGIMTSIFFIKFYLKAKG